MDKDQVQSQEELKGSEASEVNQDLSVAEKLQDIYEKKQEAEPAPEPAAEPVEKEKEPEGDPPPVAAEGDVPRGTPEEAPQFVPNPKFKVLGKEHEFDDWVRDVITNEERQNRLRELYEKAYGLDHIKPKYQETQEKYKSLEEQYQKLDSGITALDSMVKRGDYDGFFKSLGIPKENVYQWVVDQVKYQQAPPEQRQQLDAQRQAEQQAWENQTRLEQLEQQTYQQKTDFLQREMDLVLNLPDVQSVARAYDEKAGENAFFNLVREVGVSNYERSGTDLTARQAVEKALAYIKPVLGVPATQPQPAAPAAQPAASGQQTPPQPQAVRPKPKVIPNVQAGATSPVSATKVKSIDDLTALYEKKYGTG